MLQKEAVESNIPLPIVGRGKHPDFIRIVV
jgi:hypothetical protein